MDIRYQSIWCDTTLVDKQLNRVVLLLGTIHTEVTYKEKHLKLDWNTFSIPQFVSLC